MKEFMFLFRGDDKVWDSKSPEEQQMHMQEWQQWIGEMAQQQKAPAEHAHSDEEGSLVRIDRTNNCAQQYQACE